MQQKQKTMSAKNRKLRLHWAQNHQNWTAEDWKSAGLSDEYQFLLRHTDFKGPVGLVSIVQVGGGGVMVWGMFFGTLFLPVYIGYPLNALSVSTVANHIPPFMTTVSYLLMASSRTSVCQATNQSHPSLVL